MLLEHEQTSAGQVSTLRTFPGSLQPKHPSEHACDGRSPVPKVTTAIFTSALSCCLQETEFGECVSL
ncbi:hypothetical protein TNCV_1934031, partial [Trichonephila clavipes]